VRSHQSRWEYFRAMDARYRSVDQKWKQVILNEFCANTGYDRKYAIRLRNGPPPGGGPGWDPSDGGRARRNTARPGLGPAGRVGSGGLSLVGALEGAGPALDACPG